MKRSSLTQLSSEQIHLRAGDLFAKLQQGMRVDAALMMLSGSFFGNPLQRPRGQAAQEQDAQDQSALAALASTPKSRSSATQSHADAHAHAQPAGSPAAQPKALPAPGDSLHQHAATAHQVAVNGGAQRQAVSQGMNGASREYHAMQLGKGILEVEASEPKLAEDDWTHPPEQAEAPPDAVDDGASDQEVIDV